MVIMSKQGAVAQSSIMESSQSCDVVLSVKGVSKKFCRDFKRSLVYGVQDIVGELLGFRSSNNDKLRKKEFWALQDISFELRRGESLGLIGTNGSGKTTLLRIIAGLIKPDKGEVKVNGRVAPLIALGAGFNPVLTGRENIYANMSILGLSRSEIDERFDEVVAFAEVGEAIDAPVQSYSSGMASRLGFSSAIHTEPDILLIDEVLAVGDMRFRIKCYRKLAELIKKGTSFILVSHDQNSILAICNSLTYLAKGIVIESGDPHSVMSKYERDLFPDENRGQETRNKLLMPEKGLKESLGFDITYLLFRDDDENFIESVDSGQHAAFCIGVKAHRVIDNIEVNILIKELHSETDWVLRLNTLTDKEAFQALPGNHEIQLDMPFLCLKPGTYTMKLSIGEGRLRFSDAVESFIFSVEGGQTTSHCMFYQPRAWKISSNQDRDRLPLKRYSLKDTLGPMQ